MNSVKEIFDQFDPPLWIITSDHDGQRGGCVATFVMNASIVDAAPRVVVGLAQHHHTHGLVQGSGALRLHLLSDQQASLVETFGMQSGRAVDKMASLTPDFRIPESSPPRLEGVTAVLTASVETSLTIGDRTLFVCEVTDVEATAKNVPLRLSKALDSLTPEQKQTLRNQLHHDAQIDHAAILAWRNRSV